MKIKKPLPRKHPKKKPRKNKGGFFDEGKIKDDEYIDHGLIPNGDEQ